MKVGVNILLDHWKKREKWLKGGTIFFFAISCFFAGSFVFIFFVDSQLSHQIAEQVKEKKATSFEEIGKGALSLKAKKMDNPFTAISREVVLKARDSRPFGQPAEKKLLLYLANSQEERVVSFGELLFLKEVEENGYSLYTISPERTSLWIKPVELDRDTVLIKAEKEGKGAEFILREQEAQKEAYEKSYFKSIQNAKWWGKDLFLQMYGGNELAHLAKREIVEFGSGEICFVKEGDFLQFDPEGWRAVDREKITLTAPLALVRSISEQKITIHVWDETGFYCEKESLSREFQEKSPYKVEEVISSAKLRTFSQISCVFGRRRLLLSPGDWVVRGGQSWHKVRTKAEMQSIILHEFRGELFVFDEIKKEGNQLRIEGHLFNPMRTQVQKISIPVLQKVKQTKPSLQKQGRSA